MRITNTTITLLIFVLMFSIFVANVANLINVDSYDEVMDKEYINKTRHYIKMTDTTEHLMWFLQISDIHLSIFHDLSRVSDLKDFCDRTVSVFEPSVVLASGDLTDAKAPDNMGSRQYEEEWKTYKRVLNDCKVNDKTTWLDIRGNHDNFDVLNYDSKYNYYQNYSMQGPIHTRSYKHQISVGGETYSFIAIDACLEPGPKRPFNFVGILTNTEVDHVIQLAEDARHKGSNFTIWYGHYPTSCVLAPGREGIRTLLGHYPEGHVYLCGHFHQLGGLVPNMYTLQRAGFLELELADWKDNRIYRLLAMDHGMLSFIDVQHRDWPVVLITNPKHALYVIPNREPLETIIKSTHIRILAFSTSKILTVQVQINDNEWETCTLVKSPLYVLPWNPKNYLTGLHTMKVFIKDQFGREKTIIQPFSLDGTKLMFGVLPRFVLMTNISRLFQCVFGILLVICIVPLCIFKYLHYLTMHGKMKPPRLRCFFFRCIIQKLWVLSSINILFYPIIGYALYISVGPWSVGEIVEGHIGVIFAWGIFVNGAYLPGSFTYAYGVLQLLTFQVPLTLLLASVSNRRLQQHLGNTGFSKSKMFYISRSISFIFIVVIQMVFAYFFWLAYGTLAFFLGPLRTWSVLLALWLWYKTLKLSSVQLRDAAHVWGSNVSSQQETFSSNYIEETSHRDM